MPRKELEQIEAAAEKAVNIIFPTEQYIRESHIGVEGALCVRCPDSAWVMKTFPKTSFCKLEPAHELVDKITYHSKMFVAGPAEEISDDSILYFGSHNFSPSAWGNMELFGT